jgi:hypothetical protein
MKVGDKLYCKTKLSTWLTIGKYYTIVKIHPGNIIDIIDDENDVNTFNDCNVDIYFLKIKDLRKQKLKKLNIY